LNAGADSAATDPFSLMKNGGRIVQNHGILTTPRGEQFHIAGTIFPKAPVGANRNGLKGWESGGEFAEEVAGFLT
jgi:hypothetical protein